MKWIIIAWKNIWRNQRRTLLSIGIISVGTMALLIAIGFILASFYGLREITIRSDIGHMQIGMMNSFDPSSEDNQELDPALIQKLENAIDNFPEVLFSMNRILFEGLITAGEKTVSFTGRGIDPEKESRMSGGFAPIVQGTGLPLLPEKNQYSVVIAEGLAKILHVEPGDYVTVLTNIKGGSINALDLQVVGTYKTGVPEMDNRSLLVSIPTAQKLLINDSISRTIIALKHTEDTNLVSNQLKKLFPNLAIKTWQDLAFFYQQVVILYRNIFIVFGVIIVVVVLLSITNTMLMAIMERVKEIGTLMAVGIPKKQICINFSYEGLFIGLLGGILGVILSIIISLIINFSGIQMPPPPGRTTPYPLIIFMNNLAIFSVIFLMALCGWLAAIFASWKAVNMKIIDALGHN